MPVCVHANAKSLLRPICHAGNLKTRGSGHPCLQKSALILDAPVYTEAERDLTFGCAGRPFPFADVPRGSGCWELLRVKSSWLGRCFQVSALISGARKVLQKELDLLTD